MDEMITQISQPKLLSRPTRIQKQGHNRKSGIHSDMSGVSSHNKAPQRKKNSLGRKANSFLYEMILLPCSNEQSESRGTVTVTYEWVELNPSIGYIQYTWDNSTDKLFSRRWEKI